MSAPAAAERKAAHKDSGICLTIGMRNNSMFKSSSSYSYQIEKEFDIGNWVPSSTLWVAASEAGGDADGLTLRLKFTKSI
mmetsp:Transcript_6002/g.10295  ORF Transcript_6002/g.10295 Transcript_6002/m.10295 type:complete len:80 (+) Transcript_6002:42-281(+)